MELLRTEYVRLQQKLADAERKLEAATADVENGTAFASCLLRAVANLLNDKKYSDITIRFENHEIKAHKFVLAARNSNWGDIDVLNTDILDLTDISKDAGEALIKWVYTDKLDNDITNLELVLEILKISKKFSLSHLSNRCEESLIAAITVKNCIQFYKSSSEIGADKVQSHCSKLISHYWNDFSPSDFQILSAKLAYNLFKDKSNHVLHSTVR